MHVFETKMLHKAVLKRSRRKRIFHCVAYGLCRGGKISDLLQLPLSHNSSLPKILLTTNGSGLQGRTRGIN